MAGEKADILLIGRPRPLIVDGLSAAVNRSQIWRTPRTATPFWQSSRPRVRAVAVSGPVEPMNEALMARFPRLEIVSSFGVGYDHIDVKWAGEHGITVTNTPDVLNEEVADTALGLLLCTVREFPQAERFLRAGKWLEKAYPLSKATLRDRTVGMVGMGRIGKAIARRLDAFGVPVVYHSRNPQAGVPYKHYPKLVDMARDVDTLLVDRAGRADDAEHDQRRGARGARARTASSSTWRAARWSTNAALIKALKERKILSAGLDVYRQGAGGAEGADRDGERRAVSASRLGLGRDPPRDGPARGRQPAGLGRRQAAADAGARDAMAAAEAGVIICRHGPSTPRWQSFC